MGFGHFPELDGRSGAGRATQIVWPSWVHRLITAFFLGFAAAFLFVLGFAGWTAYSIFSDRAPNLPGFARPADSRELVNEEIGCIMTDDFGPYYRQMAFETNRSFGEIRGALASDFATRGWSVSLASSDELRATSPNGKLHIQYVTGPSAEAQVGREIAARDLPVLIAVTVSKCPPA